MHQERAHPLARAHRRIRLKRCTGRIIPALRVRGVLSHRYLLRPDALHLYHAIISSFVSGMDGGRDAHSKPSMERKSTFIFCADLACRTVVHLCMTIAPCDFRYATIGPGLFPAVSNMRTPASHAGNEQEGGFSEREDEGDGPSSMAARA